MDTTIERIEDGHVLEAIIDRLVFKLGVIEGCSVIEDIFHL
jgi:hypothetical protein